MTISELVHSLLKLQYEQGNGIDSNSKVLLTNYLQVMPDKCKPIELEFVDAAYDPQKGNYVEIG